VTALTGSRLGDLDPTAESAMRVHDLGSLSVEVDAVTTPIKGARLGRVLGTLLVNANRRVHVDALCDAVWGDAASDSALNTLESHILRLRKIMEPNRARRTTPTYLVNDANGYRLLLGPENADSLRFTQLGEHGDRLLASGDPERALGRYELAFALWRGRPFDPVADEVWAAAPIARLNERYGQLQEQRIDALLRVGRWNHAIVELQDLTNRLPFRERLWIQLMLAHYQAGQVESALATYRAASQVLLDTMGMEPGPELRELHQRVLAQDPTLIPGPRQPDETISLSSSADWSGARVRSADGHRAVHLPGRLTDLIGRDDELARLTDLTEHHDLVTIVGTAGCGKTRLAIEVARSAARSAPDGVWFVELATVTDPTAVADVVMATIGISEPTVGTIVATLRSYLRDRQVLLVMDNCEHLLPAIRLLLPSLLDPDSQSRFLTTSREPLGLDGEVVWTLAPLAVSDPGPTASPESGSPSSAAQVFLARVRSLDSTFLESPEALAEVEAICAAVDGIPLAIELAAGRIRSASLAEIREQVHTKLAHLSRVGFTPREHHRTVELAIEWSVQLLAPAEQTLHARLSQLPGVFTVEAARAVTGNPPIASDEVPDRLADLVHHSLLTVVRSSQPELPTRFRQLATVRAHAAHALGTIGEVDAVRQRRLAWALQLGASRPAFEVDDSEGWYDAVERDHDTLTAVLQDTLSDHPDPVGLRLLGDLANYWLLRGRHAEGTRWLEIALTQTAAPAADRGIIEIGLAAELALSDRTDRSLQLARSALTKADVLDPRSLARGLSELSFWASLRGDSALDFVDDELRRLGNDHPFIALSAEVVDAKRVMVAGEPAVAAALVADLIEQAVRDGNIDAAWSAAWVGVYCALSNEDPREGRIRLVQADEFHRRLGGSFNGELLEFEADFAALAGDYEHAARLFGRASALAFRAGTPWPIAAESEKLLADARRALSAGQFEAAWQLGDSQALE
jgi:predicted ATPase/DNA-binding SARP family transcriptional activator